MGKPAGAEDTSSDAIAVGLGGREVGGAAPGHPGSSVRPPGGPSVSCQPPGAPKRRTAATGPLRPVTCSLAEPCAPFARSAAAATVLPLACSSPSRPGAVKVSPVSHQGGAQGPSRYRRSSPGNLDAAGHGRCAPECAPAMHRAEHCAALLLLASGRALAARPGGRVRAGCGSGAGCLMTSSDPAPGAARPGNSESGAPGSCQVPPAADQPGQQAPDRAVKERPSRNPMLRRFHCRSPSRLPYRKASRRPRRLRRSAPSVKADRRPRQPSSRPLSCYLLSDLWVVVVVVGGGWWRRWWSGVDDGASHRVHTPLRGRSGPLLRLRQARRVAGAGR
ncbi:hypothetical protein BX265_8324 [Streptomyces sp. TLI_235]|nr:hypothetical protein BX265_8324 [Streptomyces sp. TLI_235]